MGCDVKEGAANVVEEVKDGAADVVYGVKEGAANVVADVKEGVAEVVDTITAAAAALMCVMIVEFDAGKGCIKSVKFESQALGFSIARAGGGCGCASAPKASVIVKEVIKCQRADKLGVKKGWAVKSVNGTEVVGFCEAKKLLEDARLKLPEVA